MTSGYELLVTIQRAAAAGRRLARAAGRTFRRAAALALAFQLVAAQSRTAWGQGRSEPQVNPQFQEELRSPAGGGGPLGEPLAEPAGAAAPAEEPAAAPVSKIQIGASAPARAAVVERVSPLDNRVSVRVKGAPLATFLDTIAAQARINFIITEGLETKPVTAFLQNVTVREALQVLLEIKGLTYQQIGRSNTYVVSPRSKAVENLITRIYTLSYIPLIPLGTSASEQASITPATTGGTSLASAAGGAAAPAGGGEQVAILQVLKSILTKSGQLALEPRTNALIVTDVPEVFPQVEQIIAELDKKAPQVMIEAQIVEIDSARTKNLGLEWGGAQGELGTFTAGSRDTRFPLLLPRNLNKVRFLDPVDNTLSGVGGTQLTTDASGGTSSTSGGAAVLGTGIKTGILDLTALSVTLRALVTRSEARFLGKPKILTLNNKSAIIQVSRSEAVSIQQAVSSGGSLTQASSSAERVSTGLVLKVTPQVNKEGYITMLVQPSFTDAQESAVSRANNRVFDPISRAASTLVRVKNGQTLVLGGLLQSTESKVVRKVPFLGYIPLIGWLFTSTSTSRKNSDLVVFITPTIITD